MAKKKKRTAEERAKLADKMDAMIKRIAGGKTRVTPKQAEDISKRTQITNSIEAVYDRMAELMFEQALNPDKR